MQFKKGKFADGRNGVWVDLKTLYSAPHKPDASNEAAFVDGVLLAF